MKTKIVTFVYFGISDFPFYGHKVQARWDRYKNSLLQLSEMRLPIVCYCGSNVYPELKKLLETNEVKNVDLKIRELEDFRHSKSMIKIKEKYPEKFNFYLEVGWAKITLMEEEMEDLRLSNIAIARMSSFKQEEALSHKEMMKKFAK